MLYNTNIMGNEDIFMFKLSLKQRIATAMPLISLTIYLFVGFQFGLWTKGLLIFLLIPLTPVILGLRKLHLTLSSAIVFIYIILGIIFGSSWWHPGWLIFFLIPIIQILTGKREEKSTFKN